MHEQALLSRRAIAAALPLAFAASSAAALPRSSAFDPVIAQIELHKMLLARSNAHPGDDDDPGFHAAVREEEAAIQALGIMTPTTAAGAAAQLVYMAEIEGSYADDNSPIRRTMLTVARALAGGLST